MPKIVKNIKQTKLKGHGKINKKAVKSSKHDEGEDAPIKGAAYDLVVVESPSKAKTIKKYLGRGYQVVASNGHIKDLPKSKLGVDVKDDFSMELVPITGKKDKILKIQQLAKSATKIYLAPDPDREGEAIAYHISEELGKKKSIYRVLFNAVTKQAVKAAIDHPTELNQFKYDSQKTRRILDRLVGYKISPILWEKVQRGLSAGRVQSVALRIITEREAEVKKFVPTQWFSIHAPMAKGGKSFEALYYGKNNDEKGELLDIKEVKKILKDVEKSGNKFSIVDVSKKERKQNPSPPFTTSKLQQDAANKLGFTAQRTMMVAQKLYEGIQLTKQGMQGLITYMRTDSVRTEPEALNALRAHIKKSYGADYLALSPIMYTRKKGAGKVQDAHEAIRPTSLDLSPDDVKGDLSKDELNLYTLIWNKYLASQMSQSIIDQTVVTFECGGHIFRANGSVIKFPGFRTIYLDSYGEGKEDDNILPDFKVGDSIKANGATESKEHWTAPPPRYNEASLVKELEEQGIGRPSTYAAIISNIQDRGYVEKMENKFFPSELGLVVCKMLVESFPEIMDVAFTAKVEELLDQIEEGEVKYKKVLKDFWKPFEKTLDKAKEEMKNLKKQQIPTNVKCLKCKTGEYFIKWGKNGQFFACSNYPECTSTEDFKKHLDGSYEIIPKKYADSTCPTCGKRMVVKRGKYGRFLACEEYPNCKTALPYVLDVSCPECKVGQFTEKQSRYGKIFYGCSNYPNCNNAMWTMPKKFKCKKCGYPVMGTKESKKNGKSLQCPKCKFTVPISETPFDGEEKKD